MLETTARNGNRYIQNINRESAFGQAHRGGQRLETGVEHCWMKIVVPDFSGHHGGSIDPNDRQILCRPVIPYSFEMISQPETTTFEFLEQMCTLTIDLASPIRRKFRKI
jgi:hypothetical protein